MGLDVPISPVCFKVLNFTFQGPNQCITMVVYFKDIYYEYFESQINRINKKTDMFFEKSWYETLKHSYSRNSRTSGEV